MASSDTTAAAAVAGGPIAAASGGTEEVLLGTDASHTDVALCVVAEPRAAARLGGDAASNLLLDNCTASLDGWGVPTRLAGYDDVRAFFRTQTAWDGVDIMFQAVARVGGTIDTWMRAQPRAPAEGDEGVTADDAAVARWYFTLLLCVDAHASLAVAPHVAATDLVASWARAVVTQHAGVAAACRARLPPASDDDNDDARHMWLQSHCVLVDAADVPRALVAHPYTLQHLLRRVRQWSMWRACVRAARSHPRTSHVPFASEEAPTSADDEARMLALMPLIPAPLLAAAAASAPPRAPADVWAALRAVSARQAAGDDAAWPLTPTTPALVTDAEAQCIRALRSRWEHVRLAPCDARAALATSSPSTPSWWLLTFDAPTAASGTALVYNAYVRDAMTRQAALGVRGSTPARLRVPPLRGDTLCLLDGGAACLALVAVALLWLCILLAPPPHAARA